MAAAYTAEVWETVVRAVCRVCQPEVRDHSRMAVNPQCGVLGGWRGRYGEVATLRDLVGVRPSEYRLTSGFSESHSRRRRISER